MQTEMLQARKKKALNSRSMALSSTGHIRRPLKGLHSFVAPPEIGGVAVKGITDTLLGKHPEPQGTLRLRSMQGRYLGVVGRRRKLVKRLKSYNASQQRDDHGRWAAVGSALNKLGKVKLRPKVQTVGSVVSGVVGTAHTIANFGHSKPHLPNIHALIKSLDQETSRMVAQRRAQKRSSFKAGYSPGEPRDDHGRWTVGGGAIGRFFNGGKSHVYAVANELYGMKRRPPDINIKTHYMITMGGQALNGYYSPSSHTVGVATGGEHPGLTTAHEIGHAIDHRGLGQPWNSRTPEAKAWRDAIEKTPEVQQWRKWEKQGYIELNGNKYRVDKSVFKYYLSNRELWARSFAQWHTGRSHVGRLKSELRVAQHARLPLQWSNSSFRSVDQEITRLMRKNGYL